MWPKQFWSVPNGFGHIEGQGMKVLNEWLWVTPLNHLGSIWFHSESSDFDRDFFTTSYRIQQGSSSEMLNSNSCFSDTYSLLHSKKSSPSWFWIVIANQNSWFRPSRNHPGDLLSGHLGLYGLLCTPAWDMLRTWFGNLVMDFTANLEMHSCSMQDPWHLIGLSLHCSLASTNWDW